MTWLYFVFAQSVFVFMGQTLTLGNLSCTPSSVRKEAVKHGKHVGKYLINRSTYHVKPFYLVKRNRSTYQAKPFYLSSETVLPIE
jgi:hypothetical protein